MNHLTQSLRRLAAAALVLLSLPVFSQLSGTYTIDPSGTGTTNYASFTAAVSALTTSGVSGPVTFNVAAGTYSEQIVIGAITGSSATNRVTFQKAPTASGAAILTFAATSTANYTVQLTAASNLTFKDLTLANTAVSGQTVGGIVEYGGSTSNIQFINNTFNGNAGTSTSSTYGALRYGSTPSTGYATGVWKFVNNTFNGTSYAINVYGSSTVNADSLIATNNTINGTYYHINAFYAKSVVINNNTISTAPGLNGFVYVYYPATSVVMNNNTMSGMAYGLYSLVTTTNTGSLTYSVNNNVINMNPAGASQYGIYIAGSSTAANKIAKVTITNNKLALIGNSFQYGIYTSYVNSTTADPSVIRNNMISCITSSPTAGVYALYPFHVANVDVDHNTVHVMGGSATTARGLYINRSTSTTAFAVSGLNIRNNIVSNMGLGYAVEIASTANTAAMIGAMSNNAYQGNAVNPFRAGTVATNYTTLAGWQTATTKDAGSAFGPIVFYSNADLHVQNALANNIGTPLASITTDIDGQSRSATTPDAGADEYTPLTCLSVNGITATNVSNSGFTSSWTSTNSGGIGKQRRMRVAGTTAWSITTVSGPANSMNVTGLLASTQYEYQIRTICSAGDTSIWSTTNLVQTTGCPAAQQCTFTLNMTDSFGDGWNGALISVQQKKGTGPWITVSTFGSTFTTGLTATGSVALCTGDSSRVIATSPGAYSYEVGFTLVDANGVVLVTRLPGTSATGTFASGFVFGGFLANCPAPCPITAVPTIPSVTSCGGLPVTLNATWSNPFHKVFWTGVNGRPNGIGASYTTGNIPTTGATVSAQLYTRNFNAAAVSGGPSIAAFAAAGTAVGYSAAPGGNFSNGFGIDVAQPFTLDSATVRAFATATGGLVKFVVRVFERQGPITAGTITPVGKLIAVTDTITVTSTSTTGQNFRVPIGLDLVPGRYHIQLGYALTSTGRLYRSTALPTGNSYPFAIGTLGSVDSVALAATGGAYSPTRVYYLFDLKATPGCTGPAVTVNIPYVSTATSVPYVENFNNGIPCNWVATAPSGATWQGKTSYTGNSYTATTLNGSPFAMVDDDGAGSSAASTNSVLTTPSFPALGYDTLRMKFLSVFKGGTWGGKGYVEVWRPTNGVFGWQTIDSLSADEGIGAAATGWAAVSKSYNVTAYQSNQFKARFRYNDGISSTGSPNWAGWWAIDNFELNGTQSPTGNVRVAVTTDLYGSEVSWKIVNTSNKLVYASGGPYQDLATYNVSAATHIDTVAIPLTGNYEFRLTDSYGDGLYDGTNTGSYIVEKLCAWGNSIIDTGSGANDNDPFGSVNGGLNGVNASWDSAVFTMDCRQPATYHVSVNMNQQTVSTNGVHIAGNFQGWNPSATAMTDANGDGVYEYTISTFVGEKIEYKFINGNAWGSDESVPVACRVPGTLNRGDSIANVADSAATVCYALCFNCAGVTFNVDMNQVTQSFTTPEVNGLWNNWCGNCNPLTDANGDGIWTTTLPLPVGTTQEYKFSADAWTIQEQNNPAAPCTNGNATNTNRVLVIPATDTVLNVVCWSQCTACDVDVTLKVNMAWEKANNAISANGVHVVGDFQGWSMATTPMTDANNDGIYEVTVTVPSNSTIKYKFINGNTWTNNEVLTAATGSCVVSDGNGNFNRVATFAYGDSTMSPVCFGKCTDCAVGLGESLQNVSLFPNPTRGQFNLARMDAATEVEVSVLDLQGKVLTVAKWNEGVETLSIDLSSFANGVYMVRMTSDEGSRTMRVSVQK